MKSKLIILSIATLLGCVSCKVMVGGAVLNQEYADMIGADFYGKDAMQSVYYAQNVFGEES